MCKFACNLKLYNYCFSKPAGTLYLQRFSLRAESKQDMSASYIIRVQSKEAQFFIGKAIISKKNANLIIGINRR